MIGDSTAEAPPITTASFTHGSCNTQWRKHALAKQVHIHKQLDRNYYTCTSSSHHHVTSAESTHLTVQFVSFVPDPIKQ